MQQSLLSSSIKMGNTTLEEQREIYARDLAAHTLRQWNAVRRSLDGAKKGEDTLGSTSNKPDMRGNLQTERNSTTQASRKAYGEQLPCT